ncbi:conserved hypothetical protein [Stenotrophomonas indicatrix]|nr:conserved hypothetical protein [Stenotrophomonas indicatrix]
MTNNTVLFPRLHALIGDIASDVPKDLAREIECALKEQFPSRSRCSSPSWMRSAGERAKTASRAPRRCSTHTPSPPSAVHCPH